MKKKGLHNAADLFAKEANLEMLECKCVLAHTIVDYILLFLHLSKIK